MMFLLLKKMILLFVSFLWMKRFQGILKKILIFRCAEFCICNICYALNISPFHNLKKVTSSILSGLRALNAFYFSVKISPGQNILIINGAHSIQKLAVQHALNEKAFVFTTCKSEQEIEIIKTMNQKIFIIDVRNNDFNKSLLETSGLGFDVILDDGTEPIENMLSLLAIRSHYLSPSPQLISKEISKSLLYKNANIGFLFEQSWVLAPTQIGRYLSAMKKIVDDVNEERFNMDNIKSIPFEKIKEDIDLIKFDKINKIVIEF